MSTHGPGTWDPVVGAQPTQRHPGTSVRAVTDADGVRWWEHVRSEPPYDVVERERAPADAEAQAAPSDGSDPRAAVHSAGDGTARMVMPDGSVVATRAAWGAPWVRT